MIEASVYQHRQSPIVSEDDVMPLPEAHSTTIERRRLYWLWCAMRYRCEKPTDKNYKNYGGRGITVCERWKTFTNFLADMGPRPQGTTLDRVDNTRGYSPDNCRWRTRKENNSNRRSCRYVSFGDETITLKEACRRLGLCYRAVLKRLIYRGWSLSDALSVPISVGNSHSSTHHRGIWHIRGQDFFSVSDAAKAFGVNQATIYKWVYGWYSTLRSKFYEGRNDCWRD